MVIAFESTRRGPIPAVRASSRPGLHHRHRRLSPGAGEERHRVDPDRSRGHRRRRQFSRQRLGVPRRRERTSDGARDCRPARVSLPDDQGVHAWPRREGGIAATGRIAAAPAHRPPRSLADPRVRVLQRPRAPFRARRRRRGAGAREDAGKGAVRRLHRSQGSRDPSAHAGVRLPTSTPASCR